MSLDGNQSGVLCVDDRRVDMGCWRWKDAPLAIHKGHFESVLVAVALLQMVDERPLLPLDLVTA